MIERIFYLMNKSGIKAIDLSNSIGVSTGNITDWKNGKSKPKTDAIIKIARYFNVTADYILGLTENPNKPLDEAFERLSCSSKIRIMTIFEESLRLEHSEIEQRSTIAAYVNAIPKILLDTKGITVSSKPRKDGRWEGKYIDDEENRKAVYGKSRQEVCDKIATGLGLIASTKAIKKTVTYGEWLNEWYEKYKVPKNGEKSLQAMRRYLDKEIIPILGNMTINKINGEQLQSFMDKFSDRPNTQDKIGDIVNSSLEKARVLGKIKVNPFESVELIGHCAEHYRALEISEQTAIFNACNEKYRRLFFFQCCTGIRIGRTLELTVEDVDRMRHQIVVFKKQKKGRKEYYRVPYIDGLIDFPESGKLFTESNYKQAGIYFRKLFEQLGIKNASMHCFRDTFISACNHIGVPHKVIQSWAGHSTLQMTTDTYMSLLKNNVDSPIITYLRELKEIDF